MEIWRNPLTTLRAPIMIDLMADPFEYAVDGSPVFYEKWMVDRAFLSSRRSEGGAVPRLIQGVPAAAAASELLHRPGDRGARTVHESRVREIGTAHGQRALRLFSQRPPPILRLGLTLTPPGSPRLFVPGCRRRKLRPGLSVSKRVVFQKWRW